MKRPTVGKIASDLMLKAPESRDPIELQRKMQEDWPKEIDICISNHLNIFDSDFYVVILTKRERLMPNVFRNYFIGKPTCPTPDYDQSVYKFHRKEGMVEYLWTVPDREACLYLKNNALFVDPKERELLGFVLDFADGTLFRRACELNGDKKILEAYGGAV